MSKIIAIITARGGSKRIPKKNIRDFCGQPIIAYPIKAALESDCFDEVMVSTDDPEIAKIAKKFGAQVPFMRSTKNSDDFSSTTDVINEVLEQYREKGINFEYACCAYPTAVFVTREKLRDAYNIFKNSTANSLIPIVKFSYPIQRALKITNNSLLQFFWENNINKRSQDLEPAYHDCGQFYFFRVKDFLLNQNLFTNNTIPFELQESEVQDIDNEEDWKIAEIKYKIIHHNNRIE